MNQRVTDSGLVVAGIVVVSFVLYFTWAPTSARPNYWEGMTGGLLPLLIPALIAGCLIAVGVYRSAYRSPANPANVSTRTTQLMGGCALVGGLLWQPGVRRSLLGLGGVSDMVPTLVTGIFQGLIVVSF